VPTQRANDHDEAERRRYQKKGWSAGKVERALQASRAARGRDHTSQDARRFREAIVGLLRRTESIRLFVHTYSGAFDTEPVHTTQRTRLTVDEYQRAFGTIPEDVLVEVAG